MTDLTEDTFASAVANGYVVVDFWAEWCGPCKTLAPHFQAAADELSPSATFVKVNVDDAPRVAQEYGVLSIPTIVVLDNGTEVGRLVGGRSAVQLIGELRDIIG